MKCIIIEDDSFYIEFLKEYCKKLDIEITTVYQDSVEAFKDIQRINESELVFLDIHMPSISGFDILRNLTNCQVIISSGDDLNAVKAFDYNIADYLRKPFTFDRFIKAIDKAKEKLKDREDQHSLLITHKSRQNNPFIYVNVNKKLVKIDINDINIIESKGDYVLIKCQKMGNLIVYSTLKNIKERLPNELFVQVHRSYIINLSKVIEIEESTVIINKDVIPISRGNKSLLMEKLNIIN